MVDSLSGVYMIQVWMRENMYAFNLFSGVDIDRYIAFCSDILYTTI